MPADVELRRFQGLTTVSPNAEGEMDQLIQATNVVFDDVGLMKARDGFHLFSNTAPADIFLGFIGSFGLFSQWLFASENAYYIWEGDKATPSLDRYETTVTASSRSAGNVVTLTVPSGHGLAVDDEIFVDLADATYDGGPFLITSSAATTVQYTQTGGPGSDASGGAGIAILVPMNILDRGVEYNNRLYFGDGRMWDGTTISTVTGAPAATLSEIASMTSHAERIWWIDRGSSQARLRFSEPGDPESWPSANFIDVNTGDGSFPAALWSFQNRVYIFKQHAIYVLETPGVPTTWILRKFMDIGCHAGSVVEYDGQLYWVAQQGAYRFNGSNVEKLSDPIQNVFDARGESNVSNTLNPIFSAIYRGQWVFGLEVGEELRTFCFNVDTAQWSEWEFNWQDYDPDSFDGRFAVTLFAEEYDAGTNGAVRSGFYMGVRDSNFPGQLLGTEVIGNSYIDETGDRNDVPDTVTEHEYSITIQTKYSDMGNPYDKKRVLDWMLEWEGGEIDFDQFDEEERTVNAILAGDPVNAGEVHQIRVPGIGYFRRLALVLLVTDFEAVGFKLYGIHGRVRARGRQVSQASQEMS